MMRDGAWRCESGSRNDSAGTRPALHFDALEGGGCYFTLTRVTSNTTAMFGGNCVRGSAP
jgi:hypothetical protein